MNTEQIRSLSTSSSCFGFGISDTTRHEFDARFTFTKQNNPIKIQVSQPAASGKPFVDIISPTWKTFNQGFPRAPVEIESASLRWFHRGHVVVVVVVTVVLPQEFERERGGRLGPGGFGGGRWRWRRAARVALALEKRLLRNEDDAVKKEEGIFFVRPTALRLRWWNSVTAKARGLRTQGEEAKPWAKIAVLTGSYS